MRLFTLALSLIVGCAIPGSAYAKDFAVAARSGQPKNVHVYRSWNRACESRLGIVKVVSKPTHGTLTPTEVTSRIGTSRTNPEETAHCAGLPTNGFRVDYVSNSGFRGVDQFQIQFTYGTYTDVDTYTVSVR